MLNRYLEIFLWFQAGSDKALLSFQAVAVAFADDKLPRLQES